MKNLWKFVLVGSVIFNFGRGVEADEVEKMEPVIVTATRVETPIKHVTQSYTVISEDEISGRKEDTVLEVLRDVPSTFVVRNGTQGANATTFLRGANSAQTLVLIDGVEVNSPTVGSFDFGHLELDNVERVEVIRGPQSTLYGSQAMGGVIHIITKKGEGKPHVAFETEGGSDDTWRGFGMASGVKGPLNYSLTSSYLTTEGEFDNDAYENLNLTGNAGLEINEKFHVDLISRFTNARKEIQDFGLTDPDPNRFLRTESTLVALKPDHWITDGWEHQFTISLVHEHLRDFDPLDPNEVGTDVLSNITNEIWTVQSQHNFFWGDLQTITLGLEYEGSQGKNNTTGDSFNGDFSFDKDLNDKAVYFQDQFNFWDKVFVVPGVRVDDQSIFGTETTPKVSGAFWILSQTKLKASWGEGFRAPSVNELVFPNFGNPDLKAEESKGWEAGFEQTFFEKKLEFDFAYFRNDFDNLIDFEVISTDPFVGHANNISKASTEGTELSACVTPWNWVTLKGSWSHLDAKNEVTGEALKRRPDDSGSLDLLLKWKQISFSTDVTLVGSRPDFGQDLSSFIKVDMALSYRLNNHWSPYVKVQNLLDDDYEEAAGFPAPGILVYGGVKGEF
ncbi:MAG: TonB-dependent receptor [Chlamydiae bacterium]|nr:TonB-dependent receptor [Chlamydiota bacterium]MBI3278082.1 TonB-dependent receptor [Chlamydiota bacterium]